jgi:hypothetical protein
MFPDAAIAAAKKSRDKSRRAGAGELIRITASAYGGGQSCATWGDAAAVKVALKKT